MYPVRMLKDKHFDKTWLCFLQHNKIITKKKKHYLERLGRNFCYLLRFVQMKVLSNNVLRKISLVQIKITTKQSVVQFGC